MTLIMIMIMDKTARPKRKGRSHRQVRGCPDKGSSKEVNHTKRPPVLWRHHIGIANLVDFKRNREAEVTRFILFAP